MRYGQADVPREVSGRGGPAVCPAAADFPRDVCLTVSRNHAVFLLYQVGKDHFVYAASQWKKRLSLAERMHRIIPGGHCCW